MEASEHAPRAADQSNSPQPHAQSTRENRTGGHAVRRAGTGRTPFHAILWVALLAALIQLAGPDLIGSRSPKATAASAPFVASEDTFVKDTRADRVYGTAATLEADTYPSNKRILVRFAVAIPSGSTITKATLNLNVVDSSSQSGSVHRVGGSWSEANTNWNNAPQIGNGVAVLGSPAIVGATVSANVTAGVPKFGGTAEFYIVTASTNGVDYGSRESLNKPTLVVEWLEATGSTPAPTEQPSPTAAATPAATRPPTATPASTPNNPPLPPDGSFQPQAPIQAAFFYPWFPNAWNQGGVFPFTNYTPSLGYYSNTNDTTIDQQLNLAAKAHMEAFISSWWGQGHHTDTALQHIIARSERAGSPYPNMRWAIYYEEEGQSDPSVSQITSDLNYLSSRLFGHPGYLRVNGKPVVFVWADGADSSGMASRWAQAKAAFGGNVFVVLKVYSGFRTDPNQPDSWHQYGPAAAYHEHLPYSATVSPGFWLKGQSPRLARDAARFETDVQRMAASGAFWQLVTTWSEWGEGTIVEPATEFGNTYIDILCRRLPGAVACSGGSITPTPAPPPLPPDPTAPPPPPGTGEAVLVGAGDIVPNCVAGASMPNAEATAALIDNIPGTVFTAGDNAYEEGSSAQYNQCYHPTWGRHKGRTRPVPGNHEYLTSGANGYYSYFGAVAGDPTKGYYAWEPMPGWRAYMLNSSNVNKGAELTWLQGDLAANPRQCVLAVFHHPVYTAGPHADDEGGMRNIWTALYDAGADLVVNGHDHSYQRYAPLNRDGTGPAAGGMREIVAGTGGKNFTTQTRVPAGLESAMDGDTNASFGVLKLTLRAGSYRWQYIPIPGKTFTDSGTQTCR